MREARGATLLELLATIAIVAILGIIAVPSFIAVRYDTERTTAVNELLHALFLARSESIKRGAIVSLCRSPDGSTCANTSSGWNDGWIVFVNLNGEEPPQRDANEPIVARYEGWRAGTITSNRPAYSFRPINQGLVNGTLLFCDARGGATARAIIISHTGRPRVSKRDSDNKPLRCGAR